MAGTTGLEPATSGVTDAYPQSPKAALHKGFRVVKGKMVGAGLTDSIRFYRIKGVICTLYAPWQTSQKANFKGIS
jgi:hypothetical protein